MIALNFDKLQVSLKRLAQVRKSVKTKALDIYRQKIFYAAELALYVSPQFSGDFVSNWHIIVDGNMPMYRPGGRDPEITVNDSENGQFKYRQEPKRAGDLEFIRPVLSRFASQLKAVQLTSRVHIVNATDLDTDGKQMTSPYDKVDLRYENIIPGSVRIEQYVRARVRDYKPQAIPKEFL